jgi:hypothetical protein
MHITSTDKFLKPTLTTKFLRDSLYDGTFRRTGDHFTQFKEQHTKGDYKGAFSAAVDRISTQIICTLAYEMPPTFPNSFNKDAKYLSTTLVTD